MSPEKIFWDGCGHGSHPFQKTRSGESSIHHATHQGWCTRQTHSREGHQQRKCSYWLISMFIRIKIITTTGHHNDGSRGISAYVNDPKRICATRTLLINRTSYIVHRQPHFQMRLLRGIEKGFAAVPWNTRQSQILRFFCSNRYVVAINQAFSSLPSSMMEYSPSWRR